MKVISAVLLFFVILSCQEPTPHLVVKNLHDSLVDNKRYFYEVEYSEGLTSEDPLFQLYGTGKLIRNDDGSLSGFYFGATEHEKNNYLHVMSLGQERISSLNSGLFDEAAEDVLSDSLHSAILLNPDWLKKLLKDAHAVTLDQKEDRHLLQFEFPALSRRIAIVSSDETKELLELAIRRTLADGKEYIRRWKFSYLNTDAYQQQVLVLQKQLKPGQGEYL